MSLFDVVVVPPQKITHYLLSLTSRDGKGKARFFFGYGFTVADWEVLADALKRHAAENPVTKTETTDYGTRYVIEGMMRTPDGRTPQLRTVWLLENAGDAPRFITAYPLEKLESADSATLPAPGKETRNGTGTR